MQNFLSNKTMQIVYAGIILLLLICAAPILSGPRGFGLSMYCIFGPGSSGSFRGFYMWINIIVSAIFILLAVPAVSG